MGKLGSENGMKYEGLRLTSTGMEDCYWRGVGISIFERTRERVFKWIKGPRHEVEL